MQTHGFLYICYIIHHFTLQLLYRGKNKQKRKKKKSSLKVAFKHMGSTIHLSQTKNLGKIISKFFEYFLFPLQHHPTLLLLHIGIFIHPNNAESFITIPLLFKALLHKQAQVSVLFCKELTQDLIKTFRIYKTRICLLD